MIIAARRVLIPALAVSLLLSAAGCPDERKRGHETLTCKDGTFTSGTRAREICEQHGGVRGE